MKQLNVAEFGGLVLVIVGAVIMTTKFMVIGAVVLCVGFCAMLYGALNHQRGLTNDRS